MTRHMTSVHHRHLLPTLQHVYIVFPRLPPQKGLPLQSQNHWHLQPQHSFTPPATVPMKSGFVKAAVTLYALKTHNTEANGLGAWHIRPTSAVLGQE